MLGRIRYGRAFAAAALTAFLVASPVMPASANTVTFDLDTLFGGSSTPTGSAPWITATFTDVGKNRVRLTLRAVDLSGHEFIGKDGFLFELLTLPKNLQALFLSGRHGNFSFDLKRRFRAHGEGQFDAMLSFFPGTRLTPSHTTSVWVLSGKGLSTSDILANSNTSGVLLAASFMQGIGKPHPNGLRSAAWISQNSQTSPVPLPSSVWLLAGALVGIGFLSRRKFQAGQSALTAS
jgi:hypothetical protein